MAEFSGECLCGAVSWSSDGPVTRSLVCHCHDCQRATSSPFTAFIGLHSGSLKWYGKINHYESSAGSYRGFCPKCGMRLYFRSDTWPSEVHIHAARLDGGQTYRPTAQVVTRSRATWLDELADIPAHDSFHQPPKES